MATRCVLCSKSINNNKTRVRTVTLDTESKIQFGYYSQHKEDLNKSLFGKKIHETCYKKYYDRWYNEFVRSIPNDSEHEAGSISNENNVVNTSCLPSILNTENLDNEDNINKNNDDDDNEQNYLFSSTTMLTNPAVIKKKKYPLNNISNSTHLPRYTIRFNETNQFSPAENSVFQDVNGKNVEKNADVDNDKNSKTDDLHKNSSVSETINCEYNNSPLNNTMVINTVIYLICTYYCV